jgi:hypothetical protein
MEVCSERIFYKIVLNLVLTVSNAKRLKLDFLTRAKSDDSRASLETSPEAMPAMPTKNGYPGAVEKGSKNSK